MNSREFSGERHIELISIWRSYSSSKNPLTKYQNVLKIHGVLIITHLPRYS
jgi:hypothetical protein